MTGGVKHILVIVDTFTKHVIYAVKRAITMVTINKLEKYMEEYGKLSAVLENVIRTLWHTKLSNLGIKVKFTAI